MVCRSAAFFEKMTATGLEQSVMTTRWLPSEPLTIQDQDSLDVAIPAAEKAGLRVVLAVYPYPPRDIEDGTARPVDFAAWLTVLAERYPTVEQFVVMNEPNQPAFLRPQFASNHTNASAALAGAFLAAGYDALKAVNPAITVVGLGLSPRGNDRPTAQSNVSTSPVRFLAALGAWYRKTGRDRPLMDGLSFHPYPDRATDPLERGYPWPNAGFVDLGRIKQALWDAFRDTPQPTTVTGLKIYLDEVGWQVDTSGCPATKGSRTLPSPTRGRRQAFTARSSAGRVRPPRGRDELLRLLRRASSGSGFQAAFTASTARRARLRHPFSPRSTRPPTGMPRRCRSSRGIRRSVSSERSSPLWRIEARRMIRVEATGRRGRPRSRLPAARPGRGDTSPPP